MSKVISFLLIIFTFHLPPLLPTISATRACNISGITYSPDAFSPNPSSLNFEFKISGEKIKDLMGKEVRLSVTQRGLWDYRTDHTTISSDTFFLTAGPGGYYRVDPLSGGYHTAVLEWKPDPNKGWPNEGFEELCSRIVYTVSDPKTCVIDPTLPSRIPPNTKLTIKFSGALRNQYVLHANNRTLETTSTDHLGQGKFTDVEIPGLNGDTINLAIRWRDNIQSSCSKRITIEFGVPQPGPPGTDPVPTPGPGGTATSGATPKVCQPGDPKCALGGGEQCDGGTGIKTALGCIHTNPAEFAKDVLKFAIGIGGGLAFLMMLLGAFQMLTSAGNPDSLKAGQDRLTSAVIGLLFVIFATLFLQVIGVSILNIPGFK